MGNAIRFKQINVPRQQGELARFKVIQGPDYGAVYVVVGAKATIGRGEENDILISDLKASRVHAEVSATATGWIIKDKGSANGILYNGNAVREAKLKINDTVTVGETTLEFVTSEAGTMMLVAPPRSLNQVQEEQKNLAEHQKKLRAMGMGALFGGGADPMAQSASAVPSSTKNKTMMWLAGAALVVFLSLGDGPPPEKVKSKAGKKDSDPTRDLSQYLPNVEVNKSSETLFKEGFREYLAGNFSRARTQFETVLQISPGHPMATLYLENCRKASESEVKIHKSQGKRSFDSGKLRDARIHFKRILRLLNRDRSSPEYIEAKALCEQVEKEMEIKSGTCEGDKS